MTMRRYALTKPISPRLIALGRLSSVRDGEVQSLRELNGHLGMSESVRAGLRDDDHVDRWREVRPAMPEHVAQEPFDPIANHCIADPCTHGDPEARAAAGCRPSDHHQMRRMSPTTFSLQTQELGTPTDPHRFGITPGNRHGSTRLLLRNADSKALTPFGPAPLQYLASTGRRHAGAEPMRTLSAAIARLVGSLHRSPGWQRTANRNIAGAKSQFSLGLVPGISAEPTRALGGNGYDSGAAGAAGAASASWAARFPG
jgi:hypothetical protein